MQKFQTFSGNGPALSPRWLNLRAAIERQMDLIAVPLGLGAKPNAAAQIRDPFLDIEQPEAILDSVTRSSGREVGKNCLAEALAVILTSDLHAVVQPAQADRHLGGRGVLGHIDQHRE